MEYVPSPLSTKPSLGKNLDDPNIKDNSIQKPHNFIYNVAFGFNKL